MSAGPGWRRNCACEERFHGSREAGILNKIAPFHRYQERRDASPARAPARLLSWVRRRRRTPREDNASQARSARPAMPPTATERCGDRPQDRGPVRRVPAKQLGGLQGSARKKPARARSAMTPMAANLSDDDIRASLRTTQPEAAACERRRQGPRRRSAQKIWRGGIAAKQRSGVRGLPRPRRAGIRRSTRGAGQSSPNTSPRSSKASGQRALQ
jgi:cytochrome c553